MESIITNDAEIQNILLDMKNYLLSQKRKYISSEREHSLAQHTEEIGTLETQKCQAILALDSMIKRLKTKPFYQWFEEKRIYSYSPKDSTQKIRFADFAYAIRVLEKLNTSHFSYGSLTYFEKFDKDHRNGNTMEDWRDGFCFKEDKAYLNLLDVLMFVLEQFSLIRWKLEDLFEEGISDAEAEKRADKAHLSHLQKTIKKEIEDRLDTDFVRLMRTLQEKGKNYVEQKFNFYRMNNVR